MNALDEDLLLEIKTLVDATTKEAAAARTPEALRRAISVAVVQAIDVGLRYQRAMFLEKRAQLRTERSASERRSSADIAGLFDTRPGFKRPNKSPISSSGESQ